MAPNPPVVDPPVQNRVQEAVEEVKEAEDGDNDAGEEKEQEEEERPQEAQAAQVKAEYEFDVTKAILLDLARHVESCFRDGGAYCGSQVIVFSICPAIDFLSHKYTFKRKQTATSLAPSSNLRRALIGTTSGRNTRISWPSVGAWA